jgi:hypothetical protein
LRLDFPVATAGESDRAYQYAAREGYPSVCVLLLQDLFRVVPVLGKFKFRWRVIG